MLDVVVVGVEILPVNLKVMTAVRFSGSNISTSELTMRVKQDPLNHWLKIHAEQVLEVRWKCSVTKKFRLWRRISSGKTLA